MKKTNRFGCLFLLCIVTSLVGCKPSSNYNENIKNLPKKEQTKAHGVRNSFLYDLINPKKTPEQKQKENEFIIRYSNDHLLNPAHPLNPNNTRDYTN